MWSLGNDSLLENAIGVSLVSALCLVIGSIPQFWYIIDRKVQRKSEWFGWFLQIVTKYELIPYIQKCRDSEYKNPYHLGHQKKGDCLGILENMIDAAVMNQINRARGSIQNHPLSLQERCSFMLKTLGETVSIAKVTSYHRLLNVEQWLLPVDASASILFFIAMMLDLLMMVTIFPISKLTKDKAMEMKRRMQQRHISKFALS